MGCNDKARLDQLILEEMVVMECSRLFSLPGDSVIGGGPDTT